MPTGVYERKPLFDRFFEKVDTTGPCWEWIASRIPDGYGQFSINNVMRRAHRVCWELLVGPIPEGLGLDHLCRNRACVNPDHLEPVTQAENNRRAWLGENHRRKTHCKWGHAFTPDNIYPGRLPNHRRCRTCHAASKKASRAKKKETL